MCSLWNIKSLLFFSHVFRYFKTPYIPQKTYEFYQNEYNHNAVTLNINLTIKILKLKSVKVDMLTSWACFVLRQRLWAKKKNAQKGMICENLLLASKLCCFTNFLSNSIRFTEPLLPYVSNIHRKFERNSLNGFNFIRKILGSVFIESACISILGHLIYYLSSICPS